MPANIKGNAIKRSVGSPGTRAGRGGVPLSGMSEEGAGKARRPTRAASIAAEGEKRSVFRVRNAAPTSQRIPREERRPDLAA